MLGRFLEISVETDDIRASLDYYLRLGLESIPVGEIWRHPYAVLSDGRLSLGLHEYQFDSPALTFVRPDLEHVVPALSRRGIHFEFSKLGDEVFNEAGFFAPDGQMIALLEARTFSPPNLDPMHPVCGRFLEYGVAVRSLEEASTIWTHLGFEPTQEDSDPYLSQLLEREDIHVRLHEAPPRKVPTLSFVSDLEAVRSFLQECHIEVSSKRGRLFFKTPEGLRIQIQQETI